jgi:hypothetical protein
MKKSLLLAFILIFHYSTGSSAQTKDGTSTKSTSDSTGVKNTSDSTSVKVTKDGTTTTTLTTDSTSITNDGTSVTSKGTVSSTSITIKQKIVIKTIDPGFETPPPLRISPKGPNAIYGGIGVKAGLTDNSTGGFAVNFGYSYQLSKAIWFDSQFGANFGGSCTSSDDGYNCGGFSGFGMDLLGGLMYRFLDWPHFKLPLNPYIKALAGLSFIFSDGPNDGFALIIRGAAGAKYSFSDEFAVGAELGLSIGPAFRNEIGAGSYSSFDLIISAEYSF